MNFLQWFLTLYASLTRHIIRSLLAILGIVLGIAAVIAMLAIGEGGKKEAVRQIQEQGIDSIYISSTPPKNDDTEIDSAEEQTYDSKKSTEGISLQHLRHIKTFDNVKSLVLFIVAGGQDIYNDKAEALNVNVVMTSPEMLKLTRCKIIQGRFLSDMDSKIGQVCVLGKKAAAKFFLYKNPIGETIHFNGITYTVVGILANPLHRKLAEGVDPENSCFINAPFSLNDSTTSLYISINAYLSIKHIPAAPDTADRCRTYLQQNLPANSFTVTAPFELLTATAKTQQLFTIILTSIAAISLLVGGIGIMNIMLANIYERTKEIGIRRALGARKIDIIMQFLGESMLLTLTGGILGTIFGVLGAKTAEWIANGSIHTAVTTESVLLALIVSITTGIIFGTYPAWKAAMLDPLIALRHE